MSFYISFYQGIPIKGYKSLEEILSYDKKTLEKEHNFIQFLFPLFVKGMYPAPLIDQKFINEVKKNNLIKKNIIRSWVIMMDFYGFDVEISPLRLIDRHEKKHWLTKGNHNYKRISRILLFLNLVDMTLLRDVFFEQLLDIMKNNKNILGNDTIQFWIDSYNQK